MSFTVAGTLPDGSCCHCSMCRKTSGHHEAGVDVDREAVTLRGADKITWYQSSENVRRGFCSVCGAPMVFDAAGADWIGLHLGSFDGPTGVRIGQHIFVGDKGDYYEIGDGAPAYETVPGR